MLYVDYQWDCSPSGIILDEEFDADKLGWKGGDYFQLINENKVFHMQNLNRSIFLRK